MAKCNCKTEKILRAREYRGVVERLYPEYLCYNPK
jgi:hypothetical protein